MKFLSIQRDLGAPRVSALNNDGSCKLILIQGSVFEHVNLGTVSYKPGKVILQLNNDCQDLQGYSLWIGPEISLLILLHCRCYQFAAYGEPYAIKSTQQL